MRTLDQSILNQRQGLEPFIVVGISWMSLTEYKYGDIDSVDDGVVPKILNLPELTQTINADGTGVASSITVKLDDTDCSILGIINRFDVYLARVNVYQCFRGQPLDFNVIIFEGSIVGPIVWSESDRSIEVQCTTRFANIQVGIWYDPTNTDILHQSLIGKTWPLPFGTPVNYPALQLQEIPTGITTIPFGVPDISILWQIAKINREIDIANKPYLALIENLVSAQAQTGSRVQTTFNDFYIPLLQKEMAANSKSLRDQINTLIVTYAEQAQYALTHNVILGGYKFPQQVPLMCKIGEQLFTCTFLGRPSDVISNPNQACPVTIVPFFPAGFPNSSGDQNPEDKNYSYSFPDIINQYNGSVTLKTPNQSAQVTQINRGSHGTDPIYTYSETVYEGGFKNYQLGYPVVKSGFTWVPPGSSLSLVDDFGMAFLVAYVPGTVINVFAYKGFNGLKKLTQVPPRYYTVQNNGNITYVVLKKPLSIISYLINERTTEAEAYMNQLASDFNGFVVDHVIPNIDWEDQIYVTFQSSIGPNIVDILTWLIINYTPYNWDWTSFTVVRGIVANYPANFVLTEHPLVDSLMNDICYQSRCSLILKDGIYYITYLAGNPSPVDYITLDYIAEDSLSVETTPLEELVTRYIATWKPDYSPDYSSPNQIIFKNNEQKYGIIEKTYDYYIFNQYDQVKKSALFWSLRTSQIFKIVKFNVFLDRLNWEAQDAIILAFGDVGPYINNNIPNTNTPIFCNTPVPCIITSLSYNTLDYTISVVLWAPVKLGQLDPYHFAWPAGLTENDYYFPINTTTSGASLGYSPGTIPPPPPFNAIATGTVDWSGWPSSEDVDANYNDFVKRFGGQPSPGDDAAAAKINQASTDQLNADIQSSINTAQAEDSVARAARGHQVADIVTPPNNANQSSTAIPTIQPEATTPVNPQITPDYSVAPVTTPTPPTGGQGSSNCFPAQIVSGSGATFLANVFLLGLNQPATTSTVNEVHNDPTLILNNGQWVTVLEVSGAYYIVQPSWAH
jgi:hypothetical protein